MLTSPSIGLYFKSHSFNSFFEHIVQIGCSWSEFYQGLCKVFKMRNTVQSGNNVSQNPGVDMAEHSVAADA